jgi:hypothetical protein
MTENVSGRDTRPFAAADLTGGRFADHQERHPVDRSATFPDSYGRLTLIQRASVVIWGYSMAVWLYVIAMQLRYANSVYWPLAVWFPIRLDYLGEIAFVLSFLFAMITASVSAIKKQIR